MRVFYCSTDIATSFLFYCLHFVAMKGCVISCRRLWSCEMMDRDAGSCMGQSFTADTSHRSESHPSPERWMQAIISVDTSRPCAPDYTAQHTWAMYEQEQNVGAECRHDMRPSVQLPSVSVADSKITTKSVIARDLRHFLEVFDVRWPWPLTFCWIYIWHIVFPPILTNLHCFVFETGARLGQKTDERDDNETYVTGQPHNKEESGGLLGRKSA